MDCKDVLKVFFLIGVCMMSVRVQAQGIDPDEGYLGQSPPGRTPKVFAPGIVSDKAWREHCQIAISPKGDEIYWSCFAEGPEKIYGCKWEHGQWTKPALADFCRSNEFITGGPVFSPDGNRLFFYSKDRTGGRGGIDAWYVQRTRTGWGEPINLGAPFNTLGDDRPPLMTLKGRAYCMPRTFPIENGEILTF